MVVGENFRSVVHGYKLDVGSPWGKDWAVAPCRGISLGCLALKSAGMEALSGGHHCRASSLQGVATCPKMELERTALDAPSVDERHLWQLLLVGPFAGDCSHGSLSLLEQRFWYQL